MNYLILLVLTIFLLDFLCCDYLSYVTTVFWRSRRRYLRVALHAYHHWPCQGSCPSISSLSYLLPMTRSCTYIGGMFISTVWMCGLQKMQSKNPPPQQRARHYITIPLQRKACRYIRGTMLAGWLKRSKKLKSYNRRDSQMVTHSSTSRPVQCLCMAERTGCPVFTDLWSYVCTVQTDRNIKS